jgi:hypothetical protein
MCERMCLPVYVCVIMCMFCGRVHTQVHTCAAAEQLKQSCAHSSTVLWQGRLLRATDTNIRKRTCCSLHSVR